MKDVIYEWIRNMVFYQLLIAIVVNLIPGNAYVKYVRFFLGMLFIVIAMQPVFQLFRLADTLDVSYVHKMLEQELEANDFEVELEKR